MATWSVSRTSASTSPSAATTTSRGSARWATRRTRGRCSAPQPRQPAASRSGPSAIDAASQVVREEDGAEGIVCGDDVDAVLAAAQEYADAGFTHLVLVQIGGGRQDPFLEWSRTTLMPAWRQAFGD